jgi:4-amino-4-deoxy-L-arabinose transferase-like glycosyltransferase
MRIKDEWKLAILYLATRIGTLLVYPIFNDEAIYLRWGRLMTEVPGFFWHSLTHDGKMPLLIWIWGYLAKLGGDTLIWGRLLSVGLGGLTLLGLVKLGELIGDKKTGKWAALIYILWPMSWWFDRLALMEAALGCGVVWLVYCWLRTIKEESLNWAAATGVIMAGLLWVKQSSLIVILSLGLVWLVLALRKQGKQWGLVIITAMCFLSLMAPLLAAPSLKKLDARNAASVYTPNELISGGFRDLGKHGLEIIGLTVGFGSWWILGLAGLRLKKEKSLAKWLLVLGLVANGLFWLLARDLNARYVYPQVLLLLPVAVLGWQQWWLKMKKPSGKWIRLMGITTIGGMGLVMSLGPAKYFTWLGSLPGMAWEKMQVTDWPSGYGIKEAVNIINQRVWEKGSVVVLLRKDSGNPEDAILLKYWGNSKVGAMYIDEYMDQRLYDKVTWPVLFISRGVQVGQLDVRKMKLINQFVKPNGLEFVGVWEVDKDKLP